MNYLKNVGISFIYIICFLLGLFYNLEMENFSEYSIYWFNFGSPLKALAKTFLGSISLCFFENGINPPLWCYHFFFLFPILMLVFLLIVFIITGKSYLYGSTLDWNSQHYNFMEYFRILFYKTKDIFPDFAFNIGAGQNIYNFSYYCRLFVKTICHRMSN